MKEFTVEFYLADSGYNTALRLVAGAIAGAAGADVDVMEDFKVCVTESALILKNCGSERVKVVFGTEGGLRAEIFGIGGEACEGDNELSLALISALVSDCEIEKDGEIIKKLTLKI